MADQPTQEQQTAGKLKVTPQKLARLPIMLPFLNNEKTYKDVVDAINPWIETRKKEMRKHDKEILAPCKGLIEFYAKTIKQLETDLDTAEIDDAVKASCKKMINVEIRPRVDIKWENLKGFIAGKLKRIRLGMYIARLNECIIHDAIKRNIDPMKLKAIAMPSYESFSKELETLETAEDRKKKIKEFEGVIKTYHEIPSLETPLSEWPKEFKDFLIVVAQFHVYIAQRIGGDEEVSQEAGEFLRRKQKEMGSTKYKCAKYLTLFSPIMPAALVGGAIGKVAREQLYARVKPYIEAWQKAEPEEAARRLPRGYGKVGVVAYRHIYLRPDIYAMHKRGDQLLEIESLLEFFPTYAQQIDMKVLKPDAEHALDLFDRWEKSKEENTWDPKLDEEVDRLLKKYYQLATRSTEKTYPGNLDSDIIKKVNKELAKIAQAEAEGEKEEAEVAAEEEKESVAKVIEEVSKAEGLTPEQRERITNLWGTIERWTTFIPASEGRNLKERIKAIKTTEPEKIDAELESLEWVCKDLIRRAEAEKENAAKALESFAERPLNVITNEPRQKSVAGLIERIKARLGNDKSIRKDLKYLNYIYKGAVMLSGLSGTITNLSHMPQQHNDLLERHTGLWEAWDTRCGAWTVDLTRKQRAEEMAKAIELDKEIGGLWWEAWKLLLGAGLDKRIVDTLKAKLDTGYFRRMSGWLNKLWAPSPIALADSCARKMDAAVVSYVPEGKSKVDALDDISQLTLVLKGAWKGELTREVLENVNAAIGTVHSAADKLLYAAESQAADPTKGQITLARKDIDEARKAFETAAQEVIRRAEKPPEAPPAPEAAAPSEAPTEEEEIDVQLDQLNIIKKCLEDLVDTLGTRIDKKTLKREGEPLLAAYVRWKESKAKKTPDPALDAAIDTFDRRISNLYLNVDLQAQPLPQNMQLSIMKDLKKALDEIDSVVSEEEKLISEILTAEDQAEALKAIVDAAAKAVPDQKGRINKLWDATQRWSTFIPLLKWRDFKKRFEAIKWAADSKAADAKLDELERLAKGLISQAEERQKQEAQALESFSKNPRDMIQLVTRRDKLGDLITHIGARGKHKSIAIDLKYLNYIYKDAVMLSSLFKTLLGLSNVPEGRTLMEKHEKLWKDWDDRCDVWTVDLTRKQRADEASEVITLNRRVRDLRWKAWKLLPASINAKAVATASAAEARLLGTAYFSRMAGWLNNLGAPDAPPAAPAPSEEEKRAVTYTYKTEAEAQVGVDLRKTKGGWQAGEAPRVRRQSYKPSDKGVKIEEGEAKLKHEAKMPDGVEHLIPAAGEAYAAAKAEEAALAKVKAEPSPKPSAPVEAASAPAEAPSLKDEDPAKWQANLVGAITPLRDAAPADSRDRKRVDKLLAKAKAAKGPTELAKVEKSLENVRRMAPPLEKS